MNCWDLLKISPTTDRVAIKKAYAARLKVTRPDDDAQAYQELREAYDFALEMANWQALEDAEPVEFSQVDILDKTEYENANDESEEQVLSKSDIATIEQQIHEADHAEFGTDTELVDLEILIQDLRSQLLSDEAALSQQWEITQNKLEQLPLSQHNHASILFANFVIEENSEFPMWLQAKMLKYFGWLGDYQKERLLGIHTTIQLQEILAFAGNLVEIEEKIEVVEVEEKIKMPQLNQRFTAAMEFLNFSKVFDGWRLFIYVFMAGGRLKWQLEKLGYIESTNGAETYDAMENNCQNPIENLLDIALWSRGFILYIISAGILFLFSLDYYINHTELLLFFSVAYFLFGKMFFVKIKEIFLVIRKFFIMGLDFFVSIIEALFSIKISNTMLSWVVWFGVLLSFYIELLFYENFSFGSFDFWLKSLALFLFFCSLSLPKLDIENKYSLSVVIFLYIQCICIVISFLQPKPGFFVLTLSTLWHVFFWILIHKLDFFEDLLNSDFEHINVKNIFFWSGALNLLLIVLIAIFYPVLIMLFARRFSNNAAASVLLISIVFSISFGDVFAIVIALTVLTTLFIINKLGELLASKYAKWMLSRAQL